VVAYLALIVAVGGVPAATAASIIIHSRNIANGAVTNPKIRNQAVGTHKIRIGAVGPARIRDGAVINPKIRNNAIGTHKIRDGQVMTSDLANGAVTSAKITDGQVMTRDLADNSVTSAKIRNGTIALGDLSAAARQSLKTTYAGPNWSIVDRSVRGNGDSYLRAGPSAAAGGHSTEPPYGIGSLGMRVGATSDKAVFGNQVAFGGMPLSDITTLSYWVFSSSDAVSPNLQFEINPNLASLPGTTFTTLSFENPAKPANAWTKIHPLMGARWVMTGAAGTQTGCTQAARCTWDDVLTRLADDNNGTPAAISFSVQFNIGTGAPALSAAVDGLQVNDHVYDFEPFGVSVVAPH
jgi:hypothetical protein